MSAHYVQRLRGSGGRTPVAESEPARLPAPQSARPLTAGGDPRLPERRLHSLDAYRGLIMIMLAFGGFGLAETAANHLSVDGGSVMWSVVHDQFRHVEWAGCALWDLIQPSFMFMVGVSMAFSYAKRRELGQPYWRMAAHAVWRSIVLILLGVFLISNWSASTDWSLVNVLTQIGLGYALLFLLWERSLLTQAVAAAAILVGTWILYVAYPTAGIPSDGAPQVGVSAEWAQQHLSGISPAWHKNANAGHALDVSLLNRLPRQESFEFNRGGYHTINFIPALATMLFGLMAGQWLRSANGPWRKVAALVLAGIAGLALGQALSLIGISPIVKRIWTPSWAIFSAGWCLLILAAFFAVVDVLGVRRWTFPLVVVGVNSIAIYCMSMLLKPWMVRTLKTHFGEDVFRLKLRFGQHVFPLIDETHAATLALYEPLIQATLVGLSFWLACFWLYRQRIFIRI